MRVCLAYDCLFPWTVGGAERWYRDLAERLAADGHEVTYLTRLQWDPGDPPRIPGVRVIAVSRSDELYGPDGNRRSARRCASAPACCGICCATAASTTSCTCARSRTSRVLAAALARRSGRYRLVVDWFEVWSRDYWASTWERSADASGYAVQRLCVRVPQHAFCFSRLHERRLVDEGLRGDHTFIGGLYDGPGGVPRAIEAEPLVVFAGRHIPEKRAPAVVAAIALARDAGLDVGGVVSR